MFEAIMFLALANAHALPASVAQTPVTALYQSSIEQLRTEPSVGVNSDSNAVLDLTLPESSPALNDLFSAGNESPMATARRSDPMAQDYALAREWRWYAEHEHIQRRASRSLPAWENPTHF